MLLLLATVVGSVWEAATLGLVVPFVGVLTDPSSMDRGRAALLVAHLPTMDRSRLILTFAAVLFTLYLLKNVFLTVLTYRQFRFVYGTQTALSHRLLSAYLHAPWTFHIVHNSSELLRDVNTEVPLVFGNVLNPLITLATEGLVTIAVIGLLLFVDPLTSLLALIVLGGTTAGYVAIIRRKTDQLGGEQLQVRGEMIKTVTQGLGGVKETKVLGREDYFTNAFGLAGLSFARANSYLATISQLPRFFLETTVVGAIVAVLAVMSWQHRATTDAFGILALCAVAAFRLMPSINRIVGCIANVRYHTSALETVHAALTTLADVSGASAEPPPDNRAMPFNETIELRHLGYRYPSSDADALTDVSLVIPKGTAVAITGPSGAGKTTLVDVIIGLLTPTRGQVLVDGRDVLERGGISTWRRSLGYIPQQVFLLDDSVRRNVAFGLPDAEIDDDRVWAALRAAQLAMLVQRLPEKLDAGVGERGVRFSGGERQRLGIARAIYHNPDILVLDEVTASLDAATEREVTQAIRSLKGTKTLVIITHRLSTIEFCDRVYEIDGGRLVGVRNPVGARPEIGA